MDEPNEQDPLLPYLNGSTCSDLRDHHSQFCYLVGLRALNHPDNEPHKPHPQSLYARALKNRRDSACMYMFTATLVNTLLLTQIVLGAALTGLAASDSSRVLITTFGALNTIIAGVIAFLKSRGQPLRSRMFRDDLSRVVDEIENSAVMWYGISASAHGYDAIDTDEQVTVRSEVARLTRLYDKAVKTNTMNDPDMYSAGTGDSYNVGLRKFAGVGPANPNAAFAAPVIPPTQSPIASPQLDQDQAASKEPEESPASKAPEATPERTTQGQKDTPAAISPPRTEDLSTKPTMSVEGKDREAPVGPSIASASNLAIDSARRIDPDESPASAARVPRKEDSHKSDRTLLENSQP